MRIAESDRSIDGSTRRRMIQLAKDLGWLDRVDGWMSQLNASHFGGTANMITVLEPLASRRPRAGEKHLQVLDDFRERGYFDAQQDADLPLFILGPMAQHRFELRLSSSEVACMRTQPASVHLREWWASLCRSCGWQSISPHVG